MKFSVIVPVYKVEPYLSTCVDSILSQTYPDFELILVDDGSPDGCPAICDEYASKDGRVKVIHQKNSGVVKARQAGVEIAQGDYLVFIDGDDDIEQNCLEKIDEVADVDIVRFGYFVCEGKYREKITLPYQTGYYSKKDIECVIFPKLIQSENAKYFPPSVWGGAFRKELFHANMLKDIRLAIGEDGACVIPCVYYADSMYILDECLYNYRLNLTSATKSRKAYDWNGPEIISKHITEKIQIDAFDFHEQLYRKIVHELFTVVVSQFNREEKYSEIRKDINLNLQNPIYAEAIEKAKFRGSLKAKLMHYALKHRRYKIIKIYHDIKK